MYREREKGIVLLIAMGFILLLAIAATSFVLMGLSEIKMAQIQNDSTRAFYLAEAGLNMYIAKRNAGESGDISWTSLGDGKYKIAEKSSYLITASGEVDGKERKIEVKLQESVPVPENAINVFGSPSKDAKIAIMEHDKKHEGEILISGFDAAADGSDTLALGVENPDVLDKIIDNLGKYLKKGGDLEDTLVGDPMNTYTYTEKKKEYEFTASIGQVDSQGFDTDLMEELAQKLADNARAMSPTHIIDLGGGEREDDLLDLDGDGEVCLGGSESDVIYITDGKLHIKEELAIAGTGTLIFDGGTFELDKADFDWEGDIYILGNEEKGDAAFKVKHAEIVIDGDMFLLGSDNGKAKFESDNNDKKHDGSTAIVGSILAFGGTGDKSEAKVKVHHGDFDMEGFITMAGTKSKLDIHQHEPKDGENNDIRIEGGICALASEKAEIKLHARGGDEGEFVIQYNSDIVNEAIQRLRNKLDLPLRIISWQEL